MNHPVQSYTIFVLLKTLPGWLALSRPHRNEIADAAFAAALVDDRVRDRHFDAEVLTVACTEVAIFETKDRAAAYFVTERWRDSLLFAHSY